MILRQPMAISPCLLLAVVLTLLTYLHTVHAGYAFLANQADCKLTCLNGGVCAFDTQHISLHKCICFIGLFEGEQCEKQVVADEPSPTTYQEEEEEDEEEDEEEGEEHHVQPEDQMENQHQEYRKTATAAEEEPEQVEFAEANAGDYETELSVVEPQEENANHEEKVEQPVVSYTPAPQPAETTQAMSMNSASEEEEEQLVVEKEPPKQPIHNIHLGDNGNFVNLPKNSRGLKQYENNRNRNSPHSEDPVATAWEYRPKKGGSRAQQQQPSQDNTTPAKQRRKKKPVKKHEEPEEEDESTGEGWMMSKRGVGKFRDSSSAVQLCPNFIALLLLLTNLRLLLL